MKDSTYTCDSCETNGLSADQVATVTMNSPALEGGNSVKHLCRAVCEQQFMDGEISGADLFLED